MIVSVLLLTISVVDFSFLENSLEIGQRKGKAVVLFSRNTHDRGTDRVSCTRKNIYRFGFKPQRFQRVSQLHNTYCSILQTHCSWHRWALDKDWYMATKYPLLTVRSTCQLLTISHGVLPYLLPLSETYLI